MSNTFIISVFVILSLRHSVNLQQFDLNSKKNAFDLYHGCSHVDIQYDIKNFDQLENCKRVYDGLKISNLNLSATESLKFPILTEITGYLYIHNVSGLKTLSNLFPNLAVIRGNVLIHGSSILITNNEDLENIGLESLGYILRGSLTIMNNPKLCYVDTIDWKKLYKSTELPFLKTLFSNNKNKEKCGKCKIGNCWSKELMQKDCNDGECSKGDLNCAGECIGGCYNSLNSSTCAACRYFANYKTENEDYEECVLKSETSTQYLYNNLYFVSKKMCQDLKAIPHNGFCSLMCPYEIKHVYNETSKQCEYKQDRFVDCKYSIYINGTDQLFDDNIRNNCSLVKDVMIRNVTFTNDKTPDEINERLFEIFNRIATVKGCLLIEDSPAILSFDFLPYLKKIGKCPIGIIENNTNVYSIVVRNNQNLQYFFSPEVARSNGAFFVQSNPSLCADYLIRYDVKSDPLHVLQSTECEIPIVNFNVLSSHKSALVQIDRLKENVDYKLVYREKGSNITIEHNLIAETHELLGLKNGATYEISILSKSKNSSEFLFKSVGKEFSTQNHSKFIEIITDDNEDISWNKVNLKWNNLNRITNKEEVLYFINLSKKEKAEKSYDRLKEKFIYSCKIKLEELQEPTGYNKYYFYALDNMNDGNTTSAMNFTIKNLEPLHYYKFDIYFCKDGNVKRCSQPVSRIFRTKELKIVKPFTLAQKIIAGFLPVFVIAVYGAYRFFYKIQKLQKQRAIVADPNTPLSDIIENEEKDKIDLSALEALKSNNFEIMLQDIEPGKNLGSGLFGEVFEAFWIRNKGEKIKVAVKTIKNAGDDYAKFIAEAMVIKNFRTHHIVKAFGCVLKREPWIVMEFMKYKDLKSFLVEKNISNSTEDVKELVDVSSGYLDVTQAFESVRNYKSDKKKSPYNIAIEIADGMAYLESIKYIHRDLAARNCMVHEDLTVKIGDFGMTRDVYVNGDYTPTEIHPIPMRWMSPESLSEGKFTTKGDVWSYAVVLFEIMTNGELPFNKFHDGLIMDLVTKRNFTLLKLLPEKYDAILVKIMEKCFKFKPQERISFEEIVEEIFPHIDTKENFRNVSYFHNQRKHYDKTLNGNIEETRL